MNTPQERIAEYLERHIDNSESERKEFADEICKLVSSDCGKELLERLNKLECDNDGLGKECERLRLLIPTTAQAMVYQSLLEKYNAAEDKLKTAASMLRSAVYERTPLGDRWIDHFDFERQEAITEFLASVEGKP